MLSSISSQENITERAAEWVKLGVDMIFHPKHVQNSENKEKLELKNT